MKGIRCSICRKAESGKLHKPGKVRDNVGQFNDVLMLDLAYEKSSDGVTHGYFVIVDEGTGWCVCKYSGPSKKGDWKTTEGHIEFLRMPGLIGQVHLIIWLQMVNVALSQMKWLRN